MGGRAGVAEQEALGDDLRLAVAVPGLGHEGVELVEPAALDPAVHAVLVEEAAAVHVAAVARGERHRQAPELLAGAERDGAVRREVRVGEVRRPAAAGAGQHEVLVRLHLGARVLDHRRAALDDVVVVVLPHDLAGLQVDLVQLAVERAPEQVELALVADDHGLAGPAAARPGLVGVLLGDLLDRRGHAAADEGLPDERELGGRRPQAVEPPRLVAQVGAHLDAVALGDDGRRRVHGHHRRHGLDEDAGGRRRRSRPGDRPACVGRAQQPVVDLLRPAAGHEDRGGDDDQEGRDDQPPVATLTPAAQLAAALAHVDPIWRPAARTVCAHDPHSVPSGAWFPGLRISARTPMHVP